MMSTPLVWFCEDIEACVSVAAGGKAVQSFTTLCALFFHHKLTAPVVSRCASGVASTLIRSKLSRLSSPSCLCLSVLIIFNCENIGTIE